MATFCAFFVPVDGCRAYHFCDISNKTTAVRFNNNMDFSDDWLLTGEKGGWNNNTPLGFDCDDGGNKECDNGDVLYGKYAIGSGDFEKGVYQCKNTGTNDYWVYIGDCYDPLTDTVYNKNITIDVPCDKAKARFNTDITGAKSCHRKCRPDKEQVIFMTCVDGFTGQTEVSSGFEKCVKDGTGRTCEYKGQSYEEGKVLKGAYCKKAEFDANNNKSGEYDGMTVKPLDSEDNVKGGPVCHVMCRNGAWDIELGHGNNKSSANAACEEGYVADTDKKKCIVAGGGNSGYSAQSAGGGGTSGPDPDINRVEAMHKAKCVETGGDWADGSYDADYSNFSFGTCSCDQSKNITKKDDTLGISPCKCISDDYVWDDPKSNGCKMTDAAKNSCLCPSDWRSMNNKWKKYINDYLPAIPLGTGGAVREKCLDQFDASEISDVLNDMVIRCEAAQRLNGCDTNGGGFKSGQEKVDFFDKFNRISNDFLTQMRACQYDACAASRENYGARNTEWSTNKKDSDNLADGQCRCVGEYMQWDASQHECVSNNADKNACVAAANSGAKWVDDGRGGGHCECPGDGNDYWDAVRELCVKSEKHEQCIPKNRGNASSIKWNQESKKCECGAVTDAKTGVVVNYEFVNNGTGYECKPVEGDNKKVAEAQKRQGNKQSADEQRTVIRGAADTLNDKLNLVGLSVWKNKDGGFNTSRLISDSVAGVVLGTAGGLIVSNIVKKNQVKGGFEDIRCVVGGQIVADWGDQFRVGRPLN